MIFLQNTGLWKVQFQDPLFDNDFISSGKNPLTNLFLMAHAIYMIFQLNLLFVFLYCYTTAITSRGGFTEAIFYCFTVWSLCSVLIASYISTKHMHLDAMKKWYKLSKSLAIWFPCLQSIIMESLDIQKWEIKRLIKKDFSHGTLSHMSEFFPSFFFSTSFIHRETHFRQVFTTAWHHGTKGFMTFIAIQKGRTNEIIFWFLH